MKLPGAFGGKSPPERGGERDEHNDGASTSQRTAALFVSSDTTALATPGTACRAFVTLRTQPLHVMPSTESPVRTEVVCMFGVADTSK